MTFRTHLNLKEKSKTRGIIKEKTGYVISSNTILNQIFKRSSFAAETGENSNEIFEFIGDHILSYYVVKIVSKRFGSLSPLTDYCFKIAENQFTEIKQSLVNNETLAKIINEWDISKYLILSKSDIKNNVANEPKAKADLLEAIVGAIAIDCNWNPDILEGVVAKTLDIDAKIDTLINTDIKARFCDVDIDNAVTKLKELAESGQCTMPKYQFSGPDAIGYDQDGNPKWVCICQVTNNNTGLIIHVESTSKKDAKKAAAYLVLCDQLNMQNKYGPNRFCIGWIYKNGKLLPYDESNNKRT